MKTFWRIDSLMECEYDKIRINYENVPFHGGKMKKVIFDVDGVLLSEERYFDIAALTVWEILYSPKYMACRQKRIILLLARSMKDALQNAGKACGEMARSYPG